jgi:NADPH:quinone reductase-like Zn-dependent oxidoreductase
MRIYRLNSSEDGRRLKKSEEQSPKLGPRDVLVRVVAASLNYRDLMILRGKYGSAREGLVPLSDGAGIVAAVGKEVARWREGDRVAPNFFRDWINGPFRESYRSTALGSDACDGVLSELVVAPEASLVRIPDSFDFEEAATLPCAAVTAWQALVVRGKLTRDDTVLVQGTGGVALFALQIATALGARAIVISSSDEKRERAAHLGAWETINYTATPDWDIEVRKLTDGIGVSHIVELGGPGTFDRSLKSLAAGGKIAQIGVLTGHGPQSNLMRLQLMNADINGISVGSCEHFTAMNDFLVAHQIKPVIDRRFTFDEAPAAYDYLASGQHFGKIVIRI